MPEITQAQSITLIGETLSNPLPKSYSTYRAMREDPTLALARALTVAPIVASQWSLEVTPDAPTDAEDFVKEQFFGLREPFLEMALLGGMDFGWQPFEVIVEPEDGKLILRKLKPLLQDITIILVDRLTGSFQGFRQSSQGTPIDVPLEASLLVSFRVEGTNWYGRSLLENARTSFNEWVEANAGAARYDKKLAGSHFVIKYPPGSSPLNGVETDNSVVAATIIKELESSGAVTVPQVVAEFQEDLATGKLAPGWDIDIQTDAGARQPSFVSRLQYLDKLKVRALIMPERAVLEGNFGTKADASTHGDLSLTNMDLTHRHVTRLLNWHVVDRLLALNFGEKARGTVKIEPAPLTDAQLSYLSSIYEKLLSNQSTIIEEYLSIDVEALKKRLGVPVSEEPRELMDLGEDNIEDDEEDTDDTSEDTDDTSEDTDDGDDS